MSIRRNIEGKGLADIVCDLIKFRKIAIAFVLFITIMPARSIWAQSYNEYEVAASSIYNFTKIVEWQSAPKAYGIGVYCPESFDFLLFKNIFTGILQQDSKTGWSITRHTGIESRFDCNILYIPGSTKTSEVIKLLKLVQDKPILTVGGNITGFCKYGGIINITPGSKLQQFEINLTIAGKSRLKVNPDFLDLKLTKVYED